MLPFTKQQLEENIRKKYVSVQKHPEADLYIYNYTQNAQFETVWNAVTLNCRGLILDGDFNVVARPLRKFFNYEEHLEQSSIKGAIPTDEVPRRFLKYDGSMGIAYELNGKVYLATRGSFTSEQAIRGTKILHEKYADCLDKFNLKDETAIFEIIYPENRIVIDYHGRDDLIQLVIIDKRTGKTLINKDMGFPRAEEFKNTGLLSLDELKNLDYENQEGFVCYYPMNDFRMKIKFKNYVLLHKIMTGVSSISIWEYLKDGKDIYEILDNVPDEFFDWVKQVIKRLEDEFNTIVKTSNMLYESATNITNLDETLITSKDKRKKLAQIINLAKDKRCIPVAFKMCDNREYNSVVWKMLRPTYEQPFKQKIDENWEK